LKTVPLLTVTEDLVSQTFYVSSYNQTTTFVARKGWAISGSYSIIEAEENACCPVCRIYAPDGETIVYEIKQTGKVSVI